jgi:hypothetical protein
MRTFFSSFLLVLLATAMSAQSNFNISNNATGNTEPFIAVDPANPQNLVAAWMQFTVYRVSIGVSHSNDGGQTWSAPITMPHLNTVFTSADVSMTFDNSGTAYMSFIDFSSLGDSGYVMVAHSTDNGQTWSVPVKAISAKETTDIPIDRPWIAVDRSGGQYNGQLYLTSKSYYEAPMPHHVWFKRSLDGGATWSALHLVDDSIPSDLVVQSMGALTVGADGNVYIGYASVDLSLSLSGRMICMKSTDGGASFTPHVIESLPVNSGITDSLYQGSYKLSANPADAHDLVWVATDSRYGDPDIVSVHSTDGGSTWSDIMRVNDDAKGNGVGQDMCWGEFSNSGVYCAAWRDRRNTGGKDTDAFEVYTSVSADGGATFSRNADLNTTPSPYIDIVRGNDFLGVCADSASVYSAWSDKRTGTTQIFASKTSLASIVSSVKGVSGDGLSAELLFSKAYPDPFSSGLTLHVEDYRAATLHITLSDIAGRIVFSNVTQHAGGVQDIPLNIGAIPAGTYMLTILTGRGSSVQLVVRTGK